jgi:hypothetical protein
MAPVLPAEQNASTSPLCSMAVAHGNAGILLLLESFGRVLGHVDDLGGGTNYFEVGSGVTVLIAAKGARRLPGR